ncbi:MAG TPA: hypothetical protein PLR13_03355, partial [Smithella sp.]|nr:hypothetical protein [Smithella sp.]HPV50450.1 hypothetical protein [Smithella sp.]HQC18400.1 hypothetical protein [Smithella sp.]
MMNIFARHQDDQKKNDPQKSFLKFSILKGFMAFRKRRDGSTYQFPFTAFRKLLFHNPLLSRDGSTYQFPFTAFRKLLF